MFNIWWEHAKLKMMNAVLMIIIMVVVGFYLVGKIDINPSANEPKKEKKQKKGSNNQDRQIDR
jgi:hypothetical protein